MTVCMHRVFFLVYQSTKLVEGNVTGHSLILNVAADVMNHTQSMFQLLKLTNMIHDSFKFILSCS